MLEAAVKQEAKMGDEIPNIQIDQPPPTPISNTQTDVHIDNARIESDRTSMTWEEMLHENNFH